MEWNGQNHARARKSAIFPIRHDSLRPCFEHQFGQDHFPFVAAEQVVKNANSPTIAAANQLEGFLCHVPNEQCLLIAPCGRKPQAGLSALLVDFHIGQGLTPMRYRQPN
jgi:hypothetical protein